MNEKIEMALELVHIWDYDPNTAAYEADLTDTEAERFFAELIG